MTKFKRKRMIGKIQTKSIILLLLIIILSTSCTQNNESATRVKTYSNENTFEISSEESSSLSVIKDFGIEIPHDFEMSVENNQIINEIETTLIIDEAKDEPSIDKSNASKISDNSTNSVVTSPETSPNESKVTIEIDKEVITTPSGPSKEAELVLKSESKVVIIPFKTITLNDNSLEIGLSKVETHGSNGFKTEIFEITYIDGIETSRKLTSSTITKQPIDKVVLIGSKNQQLETKPSEPEMPVDTTKTETKTESIPFNTINQNDSNLEKGVIKVKTDGVNGIRTFAYEVTYTDDVETSRKQISNTVTKTPIDKIVLVGTKEVTKTEGSGIFVGGKEFVKGAEPTSKGSYAHSIYSLTNEGFDQASYKGEELFKASLYYNGKILRSYFVASFLFTDGSSHYVLILTLE